MRDILFCVLILWQRCSSVLLSVKRPSQRAPTMPHQTAQARPVASLRPCNVGTWLSSKAQPGGVLCMSDGAL